METYKVNIEQVLLSYYIKYNRLTELTGESLANSVYAESNVLDVYIDLYDMLKPLYSTNVYTNNKFSIVSSIINIAAHIRNFYWTRYGVSTRIYLVYADNSSPNHRQFYKDFNNDKFYEMLNYSKINSIIQSQLEMVKILVAYFKGVYFIRKTVDFSIFTFTNNVESGSLDKVPAIVITKNKYAYQLPAMANNIIIFRPKKYNGEDISYYVNNSNVLQKFFSKLNNQETLEKLKSINPSMLSTLITLTGLPSSKLLTVCNATTGIGRVYKAITDNKISNDHVIDINYVYNQLNIFTKIDPANFKCRYDAVDLIYQCGLYIHMAESKDYSWRIDLDDRNNVYEISNKYFIDNPLDLNSLWIGGY